MAHAITEAQPVRQPPAGLHVRFRQVDYGDVTTVLDGQSARRPAESAAHVEHTRARLEQSCARQTIRGRLAATMVLIDRGEVVDGQRVEVPARCRQGLVEKPLKVAASPVRIGLLRVARGHASRLLEVGALVDGQALEVTAQAVEPELYRAQAYPLSPAQNAAAPRGDPASSGDGEADGAAELDAIGALVKIDQDGQRVARTGL